jgi:hypothetical protein
MSGKRKRCAEKRLPARTPIRGVRTAFALFTFLLSLLSPQKFYGQMPAIFPLSEVRAGQRGTGRTVFSGGRVDEFQVEILGILRNSGPKQSIILARLSGGPLAETGVMQGMSGSPVYIGGRLVGAVALAFPFAKTAITGIRPIEEMLAAGSETRTSERLPDAARMPPLDASLDAFDLTHIPGPARGGPEDGEPTLVDIATPVSFHGFSSSTLRQFEPVLRKLGLAPRQGVSSGGALAPRMGAASRLHPGDMISVQLLSGDMSAGADGTVTAIDGRRIYAFGHQFLGAGQADFPFARSEVIALLPNLNASFKISSPEEWMGSITLDHNTAIAGEIGRRAATIPLSIRLRASNGRVTAYRMEMANSPVLTPLLVQMALYSTIDASERSVGPSTYEIHGTAAFQPELPALRFDNIYAGDVGVPALASAAVASSIAYALALDFPGLRLKNVDLDVRATEKRLLLDISQVTPSKKEVLPGDAVDLYVVLSGTDGSVVRRTVTYHVPIGAPAGILQFSVTDAASANLAEYARFLSSPPRSAAQALDFLNGLRDNRKAYVRILRGDPAFSVGGETLPDPPPSLGLILSKDQSSWNSLLGQGSKMEEIAIDAGGGVVSGSQSVQIQVKQ